MHRTLLILSGKARACERLAGCLERFSAIEGYSRLFTEKLQLALKEAYANALMHGNRGTCSLPVSFSLAALSKDELLVEVTDAGAGFDLCALPDPTRPEFLLQPSGRGLYIIGSIAEITGIKRRKGRCALQLRFDPSAFPS